MQREWEMRTPRLEDVPAIVAVVDAGFDGYRKFAPYGWQPPPQGEGYADRLFAPGAWALVAEAEGEIAGIVCFRQGMAPPGTPPGVVVAHQPGLAYLWQLFVAQGWWGSGMAGDLHDAAAAEMRTQRYRRVRLWTPSGQARARAFYERRGWRASGTELADNVLGLPLVEYVLELRPG